MGSDHLQNGWAKFKKLNSSDENFEKEILHIIDSHNRRANHFVTERMIRNAAIFSFILAFCQNCQI
ncbi:hypothetical protein SAMN04487995_2241 [Dyadobacter koreensis]|uniref:Uncharacterized protein n=1 Tax=Dyadobacter koreensis TaxID=408657 RepID=A0A1H6TGU1_9BACT|nr:hypothetical protein SAMN04487995_2241 [Dyadobacter koreensis]